MAWDKKMAKPAIYIEHAKKFTALTRPILDKALNHLKSYGVSVNNAYAAITKHSKVGKDAFVDSANYEMLHATSLELGISAYRELGLNLQIKYNGHVLRDSKSNYLIKMTVDKKMDKPLGMCVLIMEKARGKGFEDITSGKIMNVMQEGRGSLYSVMATFAGLDKDLSKFEYVGNFDQKKFDRSMEEIGKLANDGKPLDKIQIDIDVNNSSKPTSYLNIDTEMSEDDPIEEIPEIGDGDEEQEEQAEQDKAQANEVFKHMHKERPGLVEQTPKQVTPSHPHPVSDSDNKYDPKSENGQTHVKTEEGVIKLKSPSNFKDNEEVFFVVDGVDNVTYRADKPEQAKALYHYLVDKHGYEFEAEIIIAKGQVAKKKRRIDFDL